MAFPLYDIGGPKAKSPDLGKLKEEILKNLSTQLDNAANSIMGLFPEQKSTGPKIQDIPNIYEQQPVPRLEPEGVYPIGVNQAAVESLASAFNAPPQLANTQLNLPSIPVVQQPQGVEPQRSTREFVQKKGEQGSAANKRTETLINVLAQLGVPLGAAIAGSVNPNLLPQAAGLAGGYVGGYQNQQEIARKQAEEELRRMASLIPKDVFGIVDKDGKKQLEKIGTASRDAYIKDLTGGNFEQALLNSLGLSAPSTQPDAAAEATKKTETTKQASPKYNLGDIVIQNGKRFKITGFDENGVPQGEVVK